MDKQYPWWRIAMVFAWVTMAAFAVFHGANAIFGAEYDRSAHVVRACAMFILVVPMVVLVTRMLDRAPLSSVGLTAIRHGRRQLLVGVACWLAPATAGVGVCLLLGWTDIALRGSVGELLLNTGALIVLVLIFEAVPEELAFRGYLMTGLSARLGPQPAIWAQAALFMLWGAINGGETSLSRSALFFAFAVIVGLLRSATGSIWAPIGFHLAFQTVAQLFGTVGGQIELSSPAVIMVVAFGALPFATAVGVSLRMRPEPSAPSAPQGAGTAPRELAVKGINYDVGTAYHPAELSVREWREHQVREDLRVIAEELHCNAVTLFGGELDRLAQAARHAAGHGLRIWVQPRLVEGTSAETLAHLRQVCLVAEEIRREYEVPVTVSVGCELSIFMRGIVPGRTFSSRTRMLTLSWPLLLWRYNRKLNRHLAEAAAVAREHFHGEICYAAGSWEGVDWRGFDLVGVNYYRDSGNQARYVSELRAFQRHGKPVVITEFGCCTYVNAGAKGGAGDGIVNWRAKPPQVKGTPTRSEREQADYLADLLELYAAEKVHGAFVFEFAEPSYPHSSQPRFDLDMASYGIVKIVSGDDRRHPKQAFTRLAELYRAPVTPAPPSSARS